MISDAQAAFERICSNKSKGEALEWDWETVYRAVWPVLVARAAKHGLPQFAADATQSAFLSVLSDLALLSSFSTIHHFVAYVSRVAINKTIDYTRRVLRQNSLEATPGLEIADSRSTAGNPLFLYAPKTLSPDEVELMRMFYIEGRTYNEIAEVCNTTERAVKTRMFQLQQRLEQLRK